LLKTLLKVLFHSARQRMLHIYEPTNLTFESVETQSWPRTDRQRIPSHRADSKASTTKTVQTISIDCSIKP